MKRKLIPLVLAFLLLSCGVASATEVLVKFKDGSTETYQLISSPGLAWRHEHTHWWHLRADRGDYSVPMKSIESIHFDLNFSGAMITFRDGKTLKGTILDTWKKVKSKYGILKLKIDTIQWLEYQR